MTMNSINTNSQALIALQSLNNTNAQMSVTQKRVSTGYRVADAKDDGGAFAVAQAVRSDVAGVIAVGEQLGGVKGILQTTFASLSVVSDTMKQVRAVLTRLADAAISADQRKTYEEQYRLLTTQVASFIDDAFYNGRTLLSTDAATGGGNITAIRNESGGTFTVNAVDGEGLKLDPNTFVPTSAELTAIEDAIKVDIGLELEAADPVGWAALTAAAKTAAINAAFAALPAAEKQVRIDTKVLAMKVQEATSMIQSGGDFDDADRLVSTALNEFGSSMAFVDNQIKYNSQKVDAMESGLGALVDADLAKESSTLEALKVRQQLGVQTLGLANQGPQVLLGLFR
jgi:flagellin